MTDRVPIEFRWAGQAMPKGSLLKLNSRVVGEITEPLPARGTDTPFTVGKALVDMNIVDRMGDNYTVPAGVSFLIVKP